MKTNLLGQSQLQLESTLERLGEPTFRGRQLFRWIYHRRERDPLRMTDLGQELRERLAKEFTVELPEILERSQSVDGTEKLLLSCDDHTRIETVLIPDRRTTTACISSQAGCPLACRFCATGTLQLQRNLTAGEIVAQALLLRELRGDDAFSNIVFMGMGEPLLNFDELLVALEILTSENGLNIAPRRITVSTSGITPKIERLAQRAPRVNLALSLHAASQSKREQIMPVAQTFALDKLIAAVKRYAQETRRRVTFEYILLDSFNDTPEDVRDLARLAQDVNCKINLIAYNPV
ncbi:MAG TPA: 23S rRNA (adenine(2503)-C(2))-methyltransferase RlmN, partial [candidate division Zixibacteria bacterium]|nr:23S rRNA (adenine(2503)-C(2))-methyltransferase RlmN [candidate division Zixibacteria bacterium]